MGSYATMLQTINFRLRCFRVLRSFSILFAAGLLLSLSQPVSAGTLQGLVLGKSNKPLPQVRLDFSGSVQLTTVTDSKGQYRIGLPGGVYRVRFSNQQRRHEEQVVVPDSTVKLHHFELSW